jgi:hypothetical protein
MVEMSVDTRAALTYAANDELARRRPGDFTAPLEPTYERALHTRVMCEHLEAIEYGEIDRLMMLPRSSESSVALERQLSTGGTGSRRNGRTRPQAWPGFPTFN